MSLLDAEQQEIDLQAAILDKRLREVAEDDQLLYDALLQQWFTLVNKKNALLRFNSFFSPYTFLFNLIS